MRHARKVKIIATLGPASATPETIAALYDAGANIFRLNFSHGSHEDHRRNHQIIRAMEAKRGDPIGILMDLQGPKLRIGTFENGEVDLHAGDVFRLDSDRKAGDTQRVGLPHPEVFQVLSQGARILLDDGKMQLKVLECGADWAKTEVLTNGTLSNRKGLNLPGVMLPISPLTEKDRADLEFGLELGVDWVALSFVQRPQDVVEAKDLIGERATVMVKVEKPLALECLSELVALADGIMVARGDLGVEMPPEEVPSRQKQIIRACRLAGKPVVVATQMLDSMVHAPAPTRAEASDVATAVYDGADAVMLSAESASGDYPVEAVGMMSRIAARSETDPLYRPLIHALNPAPEPTASDAISAAAAQVVDTIRADAIICYTTSGSTALRAARERPTVPILVLTSKIETARRLDLSWGVTAVHTKDVSSFTEMVAKACRVAKKTGMVAAGDKVVIMAGVPFGTPGATNVLRIAWID